MYRLMGRQGLLQTIHALKQTLVDLEASIENEDDSSLRSEVKLSWTSSG